MFTTCHVGSICKSRSMELDPKSRAQSLKQTLVSSSTISNGLGSNQQVKVVNFITSERKVEHVLRNHFI
jgi:hypothetical protein